MVYDNRFVQNLLSKSDFNDQIFIVWFSFFFQVLLNETKSTKGSVLLSQF